MSSFDDLTKYMTAPRAKVVTFTLDGKEYEQFDATAKRLGVTHAKLCRALLMAYWEYEASTAAQAQ